MHLWEWSDKTLGKKLWEHPDISPAASGGGTSAGIEWKPSGYNIGYNMRSNVRSNGEMLPIYPDNKVHGANMGPIWGRQDPGGPHNVPMNFAFWASIWISRNLSVNFMCYHYIYQYVPKQPTYLKVLYQFYNRFIDVRGSLVHARLVSIGDADL